MALLKSVPSTEHQIKRYGEKEIKMNLLMGCTTAELLSFGGVVVSVASLIVSYVVCKRYASGNMHIVSEALNAERLEKAATILSEETHGEGDGNIGLKLYLSDPNKYCVLMMIFQELKNAALLVLDGSLPKKVCEDKKSEIAKYLSRKQVLDFVRMNKDTFSVLYEIAKSEEIEA